MGVRASRPASGAANRTKKRNAAHAVEVKIVPSQSRWEESGRKMHEFHMTSKFYLDAPSRTLLF